MLNQITATTALTKVAGWMDAFEHPVNFPLQYDLIREELTEFKEAVTRPLSGPNSAEVLKEAADVLFVLAGFLVMAERDPDNADDHSEIETIEPMLDEFLVLVNGIKDKAPMWPELLSEAFERVVKSNMSKLGDDGKPVRNEAGKVIKGPNYEKPDLGDLGARLFTAMKPKKKAA